MHDKICDSYIQAAISAEHVTSLVMVMQGWSNNKQICTICVINWQ
jgi:hypothetical protein